jgi:hypothetical protein
VDQGIEPGATSTATSNVYHDSSNLNVETRYLDAAIHNVELGVQFFEIFPKGRVCDILSRKGPKNKKNLNVVQPAPGMFSFFFISSFLIYLFPLSIFIFLFYFYLFLFLFYLFSFILYFLVSHFIPSVLVFIYLFLLFFIFLF